MSSSLRPFPSAHSPTRVMLNFLIVTPRAFAIDAKAHGTIRYPFFNAFTGSKISRPVKGFLSCGGYLITFHIPCVRLNEALSLYLLAD
jgi:hypothetical protein